MDFFPDFGFDRVRHRNLSVRCADFEQQQSRTDVPGLCFACDFVTFRALKNAPKIELFRMLIAFFRRRFEALDL